MAWLSPVPSGNVRCRRFKDDSHHHDAPAVAECCQDLQRVRLEHDARSPTEQQLPGNYGHALISGGELIRKVAKQWGGGPIPRTYFQRTVSFDPILSNRYGKIWKHYSEYLNHSSGPPSALSAWFWSCQQSG